MIQAEKYSVVSEFVFEVFEEISNYLISFRNKY